MAQTERGGEQQTETKLRCPMCGAEFMTQDELDQHQRQAHPTK